jgi:sodium/bile acid cotransporter 7
MTNEKSNEESTTMMAASPEPEDPVDDPQSEDGSESADKQEPSCQQKAWRKWCDFYAENEFVVLVIVVICLARAYPPLGADYLQPQITSTWIAVIFIFSTSTFSVSIRTLTSFLLSSYTCSFNISHGWSGFEN